MTPSGKVIKLSMEETVNKSDSVGWFDSEERGQGKAIILENITYLKLLDC